MHLPCCSEALHAITYGFETITCVLVVGAWLPCMTMKGGDVWPVTAGTTRLFAHATSSMCDPASFCELALLCRYALHAPMRAPMQENFLSTGVSVARVRGHELHEASR